VKKVQPVVDGTNLFGFQPALVLESTLEEQQGLLRVSVEGSSLGAKL
jgi:hypothetical protein